MNIIEPQKCRGKLREGMWYDPDYYAEFKFHGCRYLMYMNGPYNKILSRHISVRGGYVDKSNSLPHLRDMRTKLGGTVLDGEIIQNLYGTVRDVTSVLSSSVDLAIQKQKERGVLSYMVFDIPFYKNRDIRGLSLCDRKAILREVMLSVNASVQSIHYVDHLTSRKKEFYEKIVNQGGEGIILKYAFSKYGEKKHWIKVKKEETFDVVITGFLDPSSLSIKKGDDKETVTRYAQKGWIGSIQIGMYVEDSEDSSGYTMMSVGSVSGIDENLRAMISRNPEKHIGRVIEIKAQSQLKSGKFEHPRFIRFRDDKSAEECIYNDNQE